jgi:hypothetical protein
MYNNMSESAKERKARLNRQLAPWRAHVASVKASNPGMSYKAVLAEASRTNPNPKYQKAASKNPRGPYRGAVGQHRGVSLAEARRLFRSYYANKSPRSMRTDLSRARKAGRVLSPCKTKSTSAGKRVCVARKSDSKDGKRSYLYRRNSGPSYYDMKGLDEGSRKGDKKKKGKGAYRKVRKDSGKQRGGYYW